MESKRHGKRFTILKYSIMRFAITFYCKQWGLFTVRFKKEINPTIGDIMIYIYQNHIKQTYAC